MNQRARRTLWFGLLALGLGLLLAVVACELLLRNFDPLGRNYETEVATYRKKAVTYVWERRQVAPADLTAADLDGRLYWHKPLLDLDLGSFDLHTNRLGFRGPEITAQKPAGTFRILVLGDSVAFGWGVNDQFTFLRRWEIELQQRFACEVVNTGLPMYDSMQEAALLRDDGIQLEPDLVLLIYVVNDIEPTRDVVEQAVLGGTPDPKEQLVAPPDAWSFTADHIDGLLPATATLLRLQSDPAVRILRALPAGTNYVPELFGKGPRGWKRSREALRTIRDLCEARHIPLVLLDHSQPAIKALPDFCHTEGIPYHAFRFSPDELRLPIRNSPLDSHANQRGHDLLLAKLRSLEAELPLTTRK